MSPTARSFLPLGAALAAMAVLALPGDGEAGIGTAGNASECCLGATSRMNSFLNPNIGEDNKFFEGGSGPVNVALAYMKPKRMKEFPQTLYEIRTPGSIVASNNGKPSFSVSFDEKTEAESMTITGGSPETITNAGLSGGKAKRLNWNGCFSSAVTFPENGDYQFTVRAKGLKNDEMFEIRIDGNADVALNDQAGDGDNHSGTGAVKLLSISAASYSDYSATLAVTSGSHDVRVCYTNDQVAPIDRDFFMDYVQIVLGNSADGCANSFLNGLKYFHPRPIDASLAGVYSAAKSYPAPEHAYDATLAQTGAGDPGTNLFKNDKYYAFLQWTHQCANSDGNCKPDTAALACATGGAAAGSPANAACQTCLTTKGYWLNPATEPWKNQDVSGAFAGNWLNFYPPKYVVARMALKTVVKKVENEKLRMVVFSNKDGAGGEVVDALKPPCGNTGAVDRKSIGDKITKLEYLDDHNPITEVMANVGEYLAEPNKWTTIFANGSSSASRGFTGPDSLADYDNPNASHCSACQKHFLMVISDGRGDEGNPACVLHSGVPKAPCLFVNKCTVEGLGLEDDGNDYIKDDAAFGQAKVTGDGKRSTPTGTCDRDYADDLARFLKGADLHTGLSGKQSLFSYAVGVGSDAKGGQTILREIAGKGGGLFTYGTNFAELEVAINLAFEDIIRRATSFSAAAVSPLQVSTGATAFVPRYRPDKSPFWPGYLFRWGLFNEFVENVDKNSDGDKSDVFLVDSTSSKNIVDEDSDGSFIIQSSGVAAVPHWEAGDRLKTRASARVIYTVLDDQAPAGKINAADTRIDFSVANAALLAPYLGLDGISFCADLMGTLGLASLNKTECAERIIRFVHGEDVLDADSDGNLTEKRDWVLGDMFHSSPVVVEPPVDHFLCDLGLNNQCARTLYAKDLRVTITPQESYPVTVGGVSTDVPAYEKYRKDKLTRRKLVLVGGNDGMLHAFDGGSALGSPAAPSVSNPFPATHDLGTGDEVWAFIPPDLLPKLRLLMTNDRHDAFVDGDAMVRDVWEDASGTTANKKEKEEFHTIAVVGERRGGNHYFALDVTDPDDPKFRWLFPQPCSPEALEVGETWMNLAPKPPPIGPVLLEKTGGISRSVPPYGATDTEERWVVFLQGGFDYNYNRGQGVYMLDVWTGGLLFKSVFDKENALKKHQKFPFAAPIAAIDYGGGTSMSPIQDGFFDTGVAVDTGGQLFVWRFHKPGHIDGTTGLVDNWFMARAFEQDGAATVSADLEDDADTNSHDIKVRDPFFYMASNTFQPDNGALRTFVGTGDRYNVRDPDAGRCRFDNPWACAKQGCEWKSDLEIKVGEKKLKTHMHFEDSALKHFKRKVENTSDTACVHFSAKQTNEISGCTGHLGKVKEREQVCAGSSGVAFACVQPHATLSTTEMGAMSNATLGTLAKNRFYGLWSYGITANRKFDDKTGAETFDTARARDTSLVDVSSVVANLDGSVASGTAAASGGRGWYYQYAGHPERTGSGSAIIASCVLWNSLENTSSAGSCGATGGNTARLYQSDIITGVPSCAESMKNSTQFVRSKSRTANAPPPEPATVVSINPFGQIKYGTQAFEPGKGEGTGVDVSTGQDLLQLIYTLDVPKSLHRCRHVDKANCR